MSISRRNWSALSSLTRQWTVEDEEEVEREKRRKVRGSSSAGDPEDDLGETPRDMPTRDSTSGTDSASGTSQGLSGEEQVQLDFMEILRVRDEKRRMRHVEVLRKQKDLEDEEAAQSSRGERGGEAWIELMGDQGDVFSPLDATFKPHPPIKPASRKPPSSTNSNTNTSHRQHENSELSCRDPEPKPSSNQSRKFVSSLSISLDKGSSSSGRDTPTSPCSSTGPLSPEERWQSPCKSPSPRAQSPFGNVHSLENGSPTNGNFEQATKPAFARQSSRTVSFRMIRKKEEEDSPLQRSASVRMVTKKFESNTDQNEDEEKASTFQRDSRNRISSRSIQEKMEKLAQASQKSEMVRFQDVAQRTLFLLDEVSRKRGLFEKEQQPSSHTSTGVSRQGFLGLSDRISRWRNKAKQPGSSHIPVDLRHVDISSKKSLFENRGEDRVSNTSAVKFK